MRPEVSIGLPVFNGERYLRESLDSILVQTFTDFELIICDNCATDGTVEICKIYAERGLRISLHLSERDRGGAWNFNPVIDEEGQRFVGIIDRSRLTTSLVLEIAKGLQ
jgi:glycosyltransferase involved in cell wall biosynthesis